MSQTSVGDESDGDGPASGPPPHRVDADMPVTAARSGTDQLPPRHPDRQRVAANTRGATARRSAKSLTADAERLASERGRADEIVVPIVAVLLGLLAIGAIGLILASRRKSRAATLIAALSTAPARWLQGGIRTEQRLASDLNERISRARRQYGI
jgi:hypothetical protein